MWFVLDANVRKDRWESSWWFHVPWWMESVGQLLRELAGGRGVATAGCIVSLGRVFCGHLRRNEFSKSNASWLRKLPRIDLSRMPTSIVYKSYMYSRFLCFLDSIFVQMSDRYACESELFVAFLYLWNDILIFWILFYLFIYLYMQLMVIVETTSLKSKIKW